VTRHVRELFKVKRSKVKVTHKKFMQSRALALVTLESKRPLIVVVAQYISCIVNRQIGVGDSKNVIVFDPVLTRHVIWRMRSGSVHIFNGNQWETLSVITQVRIGVGGFKLGGNYRRGGRCVWLLWYTL